MKAKVDLEKFICSLMKRFYKIHNIDPLTTKCWLDKVLEDQGLEYRDGEIVEIPQDSEDERIRKELIENFKWFCGDFPETTKWGKDDNLLVKDIIAWLEKQATKSVNIDIESMVSQYKQRLKSQGGVENTPVNMCLTAFRHGVENVLEELNLKKLEKQVEKKPASSAKTCKDDTLYDLLQKMPPFITVDGVDYYFVMKKTSFYTAYYKAIGEEGSGNAIFWATAFSPIDLLNEMLEILKKKGLL